MEYHILPVEEGGGRGDMMEEEIGCVRDGGSTEWRKMRKGGGRERET